MAKTRTVGSAKRFGTRYGRRNRERVGRAEATSRARHKCPQCAYVQVRRHAAGIWQCLKCGNKFASRAYTVGKPTVLKVQAEDSF